jgi:CRP-like cAMP-binding protein
VAQPSPETIASVPLFAGLEKRDLERIANSFKERHFGAGSTVASEGQSGAGFFIITQGKASVTVEGESRGSLGPGDYFG